MITQEQQKLIIKEIYTKYGFDFSHYSNASLTRRIYSFMVKERIRTYEDLESRILNSYFYFTSFVEEITVNVTEMFRDAEFFMALRQHVIPILATYPFIRIWHAGCSTGEEVYSMAILLKEAGLLQKSILYGTDINLSVIEKAKEGIMSMNNMQLYAENYTKAGGQEDFSQYYTANYNLAKIDSSLLSRIVFSSHNLSSDASFNEFQLILCRNVLIYFDKTLQNRALQVMDKSLDVLGFLALGNKESLRFSLLNSSYSIVNAKEKIWRKIK